MGWEDVVERCCLKSVCYDERMREEKRNKREEEHDESKQQKNRNETIVVF